MPDKNALRECARKAADWIVNNQVPYTPGQDHTDANCGCYTFLVRPEPFSRMLATEWVNAFSMMACAAAHRVFKEEKYRASLFAGAEYQKSLQILSPFNKKHFGAIREYTPATSWCYVRDAVSAAWGFISLFRLTGDAEYLERAKLFMEWLLREGCDRDGFPYWGVVLDEKGFNFFDVGMNPHLQGTFHGGSLNFFYQLYLATGDESYVSGRFLNLADLVVDRLQQPDGSFATFDTRAMKPVARDPQGGLHSANDDFNTLGLLGAHRVSGDRKYLDAVDRFVAYALDLYAKGRGLGKQRAALPVAANLLLEYAAYLEKPGQFDSVLEDIFGDLIAVQCAAGDRSLDGAFYEEEGKDYVCARSTQYAVVAILKYLGGDARFLGLADMI